MPRAKRLPGDRTARERAEDFACVLVPTVYVFDCGQTVSWIPLTGPLHPEAIALAAQRAGVSLYRAAYRELVKDHGPLVARKAAQAIASPVKALAGLEASRTAIAKRRAKAA